MVAETPDQVRGVEFGGDALENIEYAKPRLLGKCVAHDISTSRKMSSSRHLDFPENA